MPAVESVGALAEILNLVFEIFKAVRARTVFQFSKEGYRSLSCLTTLEFVYGDSHQVAYYVQDREILFTKDETKLPPFLYWTDGDDHFDELLVGNSSLAIRTTEQSGEATLVEPERNVTYSKGDRVKATLLAHSIDGFTKPEECYSVKIERWVGRGSLAILFPDGKKPKSIRLVYREHSDAAVVSRHAGRETYELKKTTCKRWVFVWEYRNLKPGRTYTICWQWP